MKLEAKVKDPGIIVVEMTIEMTMAEWEELRRKLQDWGDQGQLRCKIRNMQRAMEQVVRAEEAPSPQ